MKKTIAAGVIALTLPLASTANAQGAASATLGGLGAGATAAIALGALVVFGAVAANSSSGT